MNIYVGRWDLLPLSWSGINGLHNKSEKEIIHECAREMEAYAETHNVVDNRIGRYTAELFEDEFNFDTKGRFTTDIYWIRIFED